MSTPTNQTWIVRAGSAGNGPSLFCVYAPTMETARASASDSLGENARMGFTVHAVAAGYPLPPSLTLALNRIARRQIDRDDPERVVWAVEEPATFTPAERAERLIGA
ncbi:hypothetical protein [Nonomuraea sp. NPDC049028]|uniref:hypothetical protein n=1 Tax=Nonomuraea sp. NPDC049028 TaxID=3364348 RepID=UPI003719BE3C